VGENEDNNLTNIEIQKYKYKTNNEKKIHNLPALTSAPKTLPRPGRPSYHGGRE